MPHANTARMAQKSCRDFRESEANTTDAEIARENVSVAMDYLEVHAVASFLLRGLQIAEKS